MNSLFRSLGLICVIASPLIGSSEWIIGSHENVTIISNEGERRTQTVARELQRINSAIAAVMGRHPPSAKWPLKVVVCRDRMTYVEIVPDSIRSNWRRSSLWREASSHYSRGPGSNLIVLDMTADPEELEDSIYHLIGHLAIESTGEVPFWFSEGFAAICDQVRVEEKVIRFGFTNGRYSSFLRGEIPMRLGRLFSVEPDSEEFREYSLYNLFSTTSWAFVQMCMFEDNGRYRDSLAAFVENLRGIEVSEELFIRHFGLSYEEMERNLRLFLREEAFEYPELKMREKMNIVRVDFKEADASTQGLHLGSALVELGRYQDARVHLERCQTGMTVHEGSNGQRLEERQAAISAAYATLEYSAGNLDHAFGYASRAVDLGTGDPSALLIHAEAIVGNPSGVNPVTRIDEDQHNSVLRDLNGVFPFDRRNKRAHEIHSRSWLLVEKAPEQSHVNALLFACRTYPMDKEIHLNVAKVLLRSGSHQIAIGVLDHFINNTGDEAGRREAIDLLETAQSDS